MKILKLNDNVHKSLKDYLNGKSVFMQKYVENLIMESIDKNYLYSMKEDVKEGFSKYITTEYHKGKDLCYVKMMIDKVDTHLELKLTDDKFEEINSEENSLIHCKLNNYHFDIKEYGIVEMKSKVKEVYDNSRKIITIDDNDILEYKSIEFDNMMVPGVSSEKVKFDKFVDKEGLDYEKISIDYLKDNAIDDDDLCNIVIDYSNRDDVSEKNVYQKIITHIHLISHSIAINGYIGAATDVIFSTSFKDILNIDDDTSFNGMDIKFSSYLEEGEVLVYRKNNKDQTGICMLINEDYEDITQINYSLITKDFPHVYLSKISIIENDDKMIINKLPNFIDIKRCPDTKEMSSFNISVVYKHDDPAVNMLSIIVNEFTQIISKQMLTPTEYIESSEIDIDSYIKCKDGMDRTSFNVYNFLMESIYNKIKINGLDEYILCVNGNIGSFIQDYVGHVINTKYDYLHGVYQIADFEYKDIKIKLYVDPYMNDDRILVIHSASLEYGNKLLTDIKYTEGNKFMTKFDCNLESNISEIKIIDSEKNLFKMH